MKVLFTKFNFASGKNVFHFNKKIIDIKKSDIKFIKENFLDKSQYHLVIKNLGKSTTEIKKKTDTINLQKDKVIMIWYGLIMIRKTKCLMDIHTIRVEEYYTC